MNKQKQAMCPLFPDVPCPQGEEASEECRVRVNGDFDPVLYSFVHATGSAGRSSVLPKINISVSSANGSDI